MAPNLDDRWRVEALTQERSRILERLLGYAHVVVACHQGGEGIWRAALTVVRWIKAAQRCIGAAAPSLTSNKDGSRAWQPDTATSR